MPAFTVLAISRPPAAAPPEYWYDRGLEAESLTEKIEAYSRFIAHPGAGDSPFYPVVLFRRGLVYKHRGEYEAALDDFRRLNRKFSAFREPWMERVHVLFSQKRFRRAWRLLKKAAKRAAVPIRTPLSPGESEARPPDAFRIRLLQWKAALEVLLKRSRPLKRTLKELRDLSEKRVVSPAGAQALVSAFVLFDAGRIANARETLLSMFEADWNAERDPLALALLHCSESFRDFVLDAKRRVAENAWEKRWDEKRRQWQQDNWAGRYRDSLRSPLNPRWFHGDADPAAPGNGPGASTGSSGKSASRS
jgi:tetratricopeptide (TPR) repeat protein